MDTTPDKNTFSLGWDSPLFLKGVKKNEENRGKGIKKGPKKKGFHSNASCKYQIKRGLEHGELMYGVAKGKNRRREMSK